MKRKDIVVSIILIIVTCGIYGLIWMFNINDDVKTLSEDQSLPSGPVVLILSIVTCGIYGLYWIYKIGQLTNVARVKHGLSEKDNSVLYLILYLFGFGIIDYVLIQSDINDMIPEQKAM